MASSSPDPIQQVEAAFRCIVAMGTGGGGFEQTLEAARRALDPVADVNPGFVRKDASLAVVFITDEDDCSARDLGLYNPDSLLGPLSFRCFQYGFTCDQELDTTGAKTNCMPDQGWLHPVEDYVQFFNGLKAPGQLLMMAIGGPPDPVLVGLDGANLALTPSCDEPAQGKAYPALRLKSVMDALGGSGFYNTGIDPAGQPVDVDICSGDYRPALRLLAQQLTQTMVVPGVQCLSDPPLTPNGGVVCQAGDKLDADVTCNESCLVKADCVVEERINQAPPREVPRCDPSTFTKLPDASCDGSCPCWRIVPSADCLPGEAPYRFEILRTAAAAPGTTATVTCRTDPRPWGSAEVAALPQCN